MMLSALAWSITTAKRPPTQHARLRVAAVSEKQRTQARNLDLATPTTVCANESRRRRRNWLLRWHDRRELNDLRI